MNAQQIKKQKQIKRNGVFRKWHRRLGFVVSVFLLNLSVTGILLNHYEELALHKTYVSSDWLLNLYGVEKPAKATCFKSNQDSFCQIDSQLFFNSSFWQQKSAPLVGVTALDSQILVVLTNELILVSNKGRVIDSLELADSQLSTIDGLVFDSGGYFIQGDGQYWQLDADLMELTSIQFILNPKTTSIESFAPSDKLMATMADFYRQSQISHLKLVQDLHSLRFLMVSGKVANDLAAIILIILAITGFITWKRRTSNGNGN